MQSGDSLLSISNNYNCDLVQVNYSMTKIINYVSIINQDQKHAISLNAKSFIFLSSTYHLFVCEMNFSHIHECMRLDESP